MLHQQLADGGEVLDGGVELLAAVGVVAGDAIRRLADAQRLGGDADAGAVHQAHDVGDQPALPLADELGRGVVEEHLARRAAVDAQLVLQAADLDLRAALHQQQAQAAAVGDLRLAAGQHQQHLAAAVGDEPLDAVDEPVALVVLVGAELDGLEVAAGVGLGQHHRAGPLAAGQVRQVLAA